MSTLRLYVKNVKIIKPQLSPSFARWHAHQGDATLRFFDSPTTKNDSTPSTTSHCHRDSLENQNQFLLPRIFPSSRTNKNKCSLTKRVWYRSFAFLCSRHDIQSLSDRWKTAQRKPARHFSHTPVFYDSHDKIWGALLIRSQFLPQLG